MFDDLFAHEAFALIRMRGADSVTLLAGPRTDLKSFQHIKLRFVVADIPLLILGHNGAIAHDSFRRKCLKLYDVCTRSSSSVHQSQGKIQTSVVMDARFGDDRDVRSWH